MQERQKLSSVEFHGTKYGWTLLPLSGLKLSLRQLFGDLLHTATLAVSALMWVCYEYSDTALVTDNWQTFSII